MLVHGTCVARHGRGLLIRGHPGAGKSRLALRLLSLGFELVADDRVDLQGSVATAPPGSSGLLEVRGLGIYRLGFVPFTSLVLALVPGRPARVASPRTCELTAVPEITVDYGEVAAGEVVNMAFDCALRRIVEIAGPITR